VQFNLALTLSLCVEAQQGQPPAPTVPQITVKVNEVIVPVVVRNAQGESVGTLTKEDCQVFDDGKLQTLTGFSVTEHTGESNPAVAPAPANNGSPVAPQPPSQAERSVVYVFDDLNMSSSELTQAKQAASKLFETSLPASDMAAVASTSGSNTGLTRDHAKLQQAIRNLKAQGPTLLTVYGGFAWQQINYQQAVFHSPTQQVTSGLLGTELDLFRFDKTTLTLRANLLPAITDPGRVHFLLNTSYYVKLWGKLKWNFTLYGNWDNRPPPGFVGSDYGATSGLSVSFGNH
jgi:VWFA-related protein